MVFLAAFVQSPAFSVSTPNSGSLAVTWQGRALLSASGSDLAPKQREAHEPAQPVFLGYPHGPKTSEFVPKGAMRDTYTVELAPFTAVVKARSGSFACRSSSTATVGSSFGRAVDYMADSIYDRSSDWLLTFHGAYVAITPKGKSDFEVYSAGPCSIEFKPNYYRDHLGYYLWDKKKPLWTKPVAGWCSWMADLQDVKEEDMLEAARFFSQNLKDYGYDVIQIDDGYQRVKQFGQDATGHEPFSDYWTKPNEKFPHGMEWLAHQIKDLGMTPGVWVGYYLPLGLQHAEGYVTDSDGKPHKGPWVNYAMNGLVKPAIDEGYIDTIREFKRQGWDYFKIDTLRHILYDNYRQTPEYWKKRGESMEQAYRAIMSATKKAAGGSYVLACWGTLPELAGLPDGARIGEDVGPDFDSMRRTAKYIAQFQHLNNVVWHNDPDYMCLRVPVEQARAWATMNFLAGGHLMVSDKIPAYDSEHLDVMRKVGPPISTSPSNVAPVGSDPEFMTLNAEKDGEHWMVMARFAWEDLQARTITPDPAGNAERFPGVGLPHVLAFDFWDEKFLGSGSSWTFHELKKGSCQVIGIRPDLGRPQVLGTNRHLSQGVYELEQVRWNGRTLSGRFKRGSGQAWTLYIHIPKGWHAIKVSSTAAAEQTGEVLKLVFPVGSTAVDWSVEAGKG